MRPALGDDGLLSLLLDKGGVVNAKPFEQRRPWWDTLLVGFGPTLLLVGLFVLMARRAAAGGGLGGLGGLGRSRARRCERSEQRTASTIVRPGGCAFAHHISPSHAQMGF